jgi:hypothetical protein
MAGLIAASGLTPPANFLRGVDEQARLRVWRMRETPGVVECYRELQRRWAITMDEDWRLGDPWTDIPEEVR